MALRRDGSCFICARELAAGTCAQWDSAAKTVTCLGCIGSTEPAPEASSPPLVEPVPIDHGSPGASARREHERRHAKHEKRIEQTWGTGRIGKIAKVLSDDPQTTKAWAKGADGEERVAKALHEGLGDNAVVLHDRKVPGTRGNIDHLVIARSGVWIIDAKKYSGKVEKRDVGGWFSTDIRLYVGGRDQTKLIDGLEWQAKAVRTAVGEATDVPIHRALSFVDAEWPPFFAKPLRLKDVWISWPKKLAELILAVDVPLSEEQVDQIARQLSDRLPAN